MARNSSKNTESKSSGLGSDNRGNRQNTPLTEEQEIALKGIEEEIKYYQNLLRVTKSKRLKIKKVLDNIESIITGDIILDILPDENSDEIKNSLIIDKRDIINNLNGFNTTEIMETVTTQEYVSYGFADSFAGSYQDVTTEVGTGVTVSGFTEDDIRAANDLLNSIFNSNLVKELIFRSTELNESELYLPIYRNQIATLNASTDAKDVLLTALSEIETNAL